VEHAARHQRIDIRVSDIIERHGGGRLRARGQGSRKESRREQNPTRL